jgi:hypothetical protein
MSFFNFYLNYNSTPARDRPPLASATSAGHTLPYLASDGNPLIIVSDADEYAPASKNAKVSARGSSRVVKCEFRGCGEAFSTNLMRQHVAYHLLHDDTAQVAEPCGLCGVRPHAQYGSEHLGGCSGWLEKGTKRSLKPQHRCRTIGQIEYSHGAAMKSSGGAPSTNHLVACPECPQKPMQQFFWTYRCLKGHWDRAHSTIKMPEVLENVIKIDDKEREGLKRFSKAKGPVKAKNNKKRKRAKGKKVGDERRNFGEAVRNWEAEEQAEEVAEAEASDNQAPNNQAPNNQAPNDQASNNQASNDQAPNNQAPLETRHQM